MGIESLGEMLLRGRTLLRFVISSRNMDVMLVENIMRTNRADGFIRNITDNRVKSQIKFPQEEDLSGAAIAILRLQDVYRLDTTDLSNGIIMGDKVAHKLSAHDSFEVGRAAYNQRDYYHTLTWMQAALNKLENEDPKTVAETEILEYLAYALYQQGNVRRALALTKRLAAIAPNHPRARGKYFLKFPTTRLIF
ncbi:tetratricopeptide repeat protein [Dictyocaulus viviparus]|uniref:Tetratricopeptide repeat protein n=1 Tax=Dictyocaulus viviparus TaxID=29172 RepID=A0A0D8XUM6_DICVI|nr:tetratricopeptide repeat protein [Dictyocaulus viviparus]